MAKIIGIDLGTTYSAVATIDNTGRPRIILNEGKNITASCVMLENDQLVVGDRPEALFGHPDIEVGARFKRHMGTNHITELGPRKFTPTDLSAAVLSEMKKIAEREIGEIQEAVVTIPANFMQEARDATLLAAKKANLNVKHIINEPTAAALYYAHLNDSKLNGYYAVYDLGGGTFDVSIVHAQGNNIEVIASEGVARLGGDDFDKALRDLFVKKAHSELGLEIEPSSIPLSDVTKRKVQLSSRESVKHLIEGEIIEVTRKEFENAISALVSQTEFHCEAVLEDANLEASDLEEVFLAGGSTRIPFVQESIKRVFQKSPTATADVDEVVALGASIYAAVKADKEILSVAQSVTVSKMKVSEIATYYFGTISVNFNESRKTEELQNTVIISKGEKIPCSRTKSFATMHDGQKSIQCTVTKSSSPESDPRFVNFVWEGNLDLPEGRPKGQEVSVTYEFDQNGMMKCNFLDVSSGRRTEIELDSLSREPLQSEIDKFLVD